MNSSPADPILSIVIVPLEGGTARSSTSRLPRLPQHIEQCSQQSVAAGQLRLDSPVLDDDFFKFLNYSYGANFEHPSRIANAAAIKGHFTYLLFNRRQVAAIGIL